MSDLLLRLQALEMTVENLEMRAEYLLNRTCYLLDKVIVQFFLLFNSLSSR